LIIYGVVINMNEAQVGTGHDWADPALARRSMELMAEMVMPAVNAAMR